MRVRFGDCVLDTDTRELFRNDEPVHLPPKAFRVLELLVENRPRAVAKGEIHDKIWPGTYVSEATLASAISDIRAAIGEGGQDFRFIRTVHGHGYAFSGEATNLTVTPLVVGTPYRLVHAEAEIPLSMGENLLGRDSGVQIRINDASVSRQHARITVGESSATIQDLGSKNGTFLRESRLDSPRLLADGDEIRVGDVLITFRFTGGDQSTRTAGRGESRNKSAKDSLLRQKTGTKRRSHA